MNGRWWPRESSVLMVESRGDRTTAKAKQRRRKMLLEDGWNMTERKKYTSHVCYIYKTQNATALTELTVKRWQQGCQKQCNL